MRQNLLKSGAVYAAGMIIPKFMSILLLPVFTQVLGPEDYGILAYTNSIIEFIFVFSVLSLNSYVLRFWLDLDPEDERGRRRLVGAVFTFLCAFNVVLLAGCFVIGPLAIAGFDVQVPFFPYFALALTANYFNMTAVIPLAAFRLLDRPGAYVGLTISRSLLQYAVSWVLVVHLGWGLLGMYVAQVGVYALYSVIFVRVIWRHGTFVWDLGLVRKGLVFALPLLPGALAHLVIRVIDRVMLEAHVSMNQLGIYSIGYTLGFFSLMVLVHGGYRAYEPAIFQSWNQDGFDVFWRKVRGVYLSLILTMGVGVGLLGQEFLVVLTTPQFHEAGRVVPVVALGACLQAIGLMFTVLLVAAKKTGAATGVVLVAAAVNVAVNLVLIPALGIMGAAWSSVLSFGVMIPLAYWICERDGLIRARGILARDLAALATAAVLVGGVVFGISPALSWSWLGIKLLLVLAYAALVAVLYGVVRPRR
ncbi:MAG: oligosaccharide flippase family protein [Pseudomonadota bacterium]